MVVNKFFVRRAPGYHQPPSSEGEEEQDAVEEEEQHELEMLNRAEQGQQITARNAAFSEIMSSPSKQQKQHRGEEEDSSCHIFTKEFWSKLWLRVLYEGALWIAALPHLVLKQIFLSWGAMYIFRNLAYVRHEQGPRLKDLGFELIPEHDNDFWSEFFLYTNCVTAYLMLFTLPILWNFAHSRGVYSANIFIKIVNIQCVGHLLRFFTFISTSLPGPAPHCQPGAPLYRDSLTVYEIFTRRSRVHVDPNCGDLIFSGHMFQDLSFCVVMLAHVKQLFPPKYRLLGRVFAGIMIATVMIQPYFILRARNHYTVDVVVSLYVAPMVWWTMEGFYTTQFYQTCAAWWGGLVPEFISTYLQRENPCIFPTAAQEAEYLADKYSMENQDLNCLKRLIGATNDSSVLYFDEAEEMPLIHHPTAFIQCESNSTGKDEKSNEVMNGHNGHTKRSITCSCDHAENGGPTIQRRLRSM